MSGAYFDLIRLSRSTSRRIDRYAKHPVPKVCLHGALVSFEAEREASDVVPRGALHHAVILVLAPDLVLATTRYDQALVHDRDIDLIVLDTGMVVTGHLTALYRAAGHYPKMRLTRHMRHPDHVQENLSKRGRMALVRARAAAQWAERPRLLRSERARLRQLHQLAAPA